LRADSPRLMCRPKAERVAAAEAAEVEEEVEEEEEAAEAAEAAEAEATGAAVMVPVQTLASASTHRLPPRDTVLP
jgi:hypothetical protein